jgi:hypothetical protein
VATKKPSSLSSQVKEAELQNRLLRLTLANASILSKTRRVEAFKKFQARYDGVEGSASPSGAKRRKPPVETAHETGSTSQQLPPYKRLLALALLRDAARNFSTMR